MPEIKDENKVRIKKINLDGKDIKLELKELHAEVKVVDEEQGVIEAYVSVFGNVDSYREVVDKGAFTEFLANNFPRYPKGVWAHDWSLPIAKTLEAREDERGLYIKGQLIKGVQKADEAYLLLKAGVITDFSFGFYVNEDEMDRETGVRHLKKISIYEWSPVLVGANPKATLVDVKADGQEATPTDPEPKPQEDKPADETPTGDDTEKPAEDTPAGEDDEKGLKSGRVLSAKNQALVENALESMKTAIESLEALKSATEDSPDTDGLKPEVDQRHKKGAIKLLVRDVKQADKAIEKFLFRAKKFENN